MATDYYAVLEINRAASLETVKQAFRKLALKHHPEKNPGRMKESERRFTEICEAYEVLSDAKLRALFDQYGEDGLKHGGTGSFGVPGGYKFSGNADAVFRQFFGVANPFECIGDFGAMQSTEHQFFSQEGARNKNPPQCPTLHITLPCTLENYYHGARKPFTYQISHRDSEGTLVKNEEKQQEVNLQKGTPTGERIRFSKCGHIREGWIQGDVVVVLAEEDHVRYKRNGKDLLLNHDITLQEALTGFSIEVETLDCKKLSIFVNEVVHPTTVKKVQTEGLPDPSGDKPGDILISFTTTFPTYLTAEQRSEIKRVLNQT